MSQKRAAPRTAAGRSRSYRSRRLASGRPVADSPHRRIAATPPGTERTAASFSSTQRRLRRIDVDGEDAPRVVQEEADRVVAGRSDGDDEASRRDPQRPPRDGEVLPAVGVEEPRTQRCRRGRPGVIADPSVVRRQASRRRPEADDAARAVHVRHRSAPDRGHEAVDPDDRRQAELAGDDRGMGEQAAALDEEPGGREQDRHPPRIGGPCHDDLARPWRDAARILDGKAAPADAPAQTGVPPAPGRPPCCRGGQRPAGARVGGRGATGPAVSNREGGPGSAANRANRSRRSATMTRRSTGGIVPRIAPRISAMSR